MTDSRWHFGGALFGFDKKFDNISFCFDDRGCIHAVCRQGNELWHYVRGSQFQWAEEGVLIGTGVSGMGQVLVGPIDGHLEVIWPTEDGQGSHGWSIPTDFKDPSFLDQDYVWKWVCTKSLRLVGENCQDTEYIKFIKGQEPTEVCTNCMASNGLIVQEGNIYYKGKKIKLVGNSWRRVLSAELKLTPPLDSETLESYEQKVKNSGLNFVVEDAVDCIKYGNFLRSHCIRMRDMGVIIELILADEGGEYAEHFGNYQDTLDCVSDLDNIIFRDQNEFIDNVSIDTALKRAHTIVSSELICSGGGWGNSNQGETLAWQYLQESPCQIISMHRPYPPIESYQQYIDKLKNNFPDKPIVESEFLLNNPEDSKTYANVGFQWGLQGFNCYGDQWETWETMSKICGEQNG